MAPLTPRLVVPIDVKKQPWEQKIPLHNRWHPDIPPVADVTEGELFRVEMVDWTGGRVRDDNSADDIKFLNLTITHYLSGPLRIVDSEGVPASPGDLLVVEIRNLGPLPGDEWGYTAIFERENGGGFLTDHFPSARKAIWYFEGIYAYSPQIPGVRFPGLTHPGIMGTAPSVELLNIWNEREKRLAETSPETLKLCEIQKGTAEWHKMSNEAARTIPGRENGGNCDIKNLSRGYKVYLPVFVEGANLSTGDMHFSQGDGEVSFCGAIEMSGFLELNVDESGKQHFLDASVAYKRAVLNAIEYLSRFGYSKEQVGSRVANCYLEVNANADKLDLIMDRLTQTWPDQTNYQAHYLSGPLRIVDSEGVPASPGDLLAVEICNLGPLPGDEWGYTAILERDNGGGFLTDHFPSARKAIWYFEGIYAYSPQIPGVRFPGLTHPGVVGTAPSVELLNIWNGREKRLAETNQETLKLCEVLHQRPLAHLPTPKNCLLGKAWSTFFTLMHMIKCQTLANLKYIFLHRWSKCHVCNEYNVMQIQEGTAEWHKIANEAARTIAGRENGGNCDIKNLSRGSKVYLPVFVEGANLSTGDMHFSQGDGEISLCGAIEMSGFLELK
ncbi:hypothetical protein HU200_007739 [Digitaria exilis]|uniref:Formamidase n=1 Tax=Digitaria exilis TaxID=1010633 RepID=A0A835KUB7_9POAL|nr:hypothetical protein HU200_007739 [Digitaria exilis]